MNLELLDKSIFVEAMKEQLTIDSKTTALVAVDMHQGHLDPEVGHMIVPEEERKRVLKNGKRLIEIVRNFKIPIIHVIVSRRPIERKRMVNPFLVCAQIVNAKLEPNERGWVGKAGDPETWWQPKIMPELAPEPTDYVINNKKTYNIYYGTDLEILLRTLRIDTVVLMGINTNTCDLCSSFETVNRGLKLVVISDCVASAYGYDLHLFALQNIARCLGWVLSIPEFERKLGSIPPSMAT
jgi:nicotinamidase-related amidase